jgi:hypothetical protein
MTTPAWSELEQVIRRSPPLRHIEPSDVAEPVRRYFDAAMPDGPVTASAAVLEMRGQIRIGRWLPFTAQQLLAPRLGTVWEATVGHVIVGSDRYVGGTGGMDWKLFGLIPFVHAEGPDVTRSAAERAAGESIWVPYAVAPWTNTRWAAEGPDRITGAFDTDGHEVSVEHRLDRDGRLITSSFLRWGDPDRTGTWGQHPFGVEVSAHRRFGAVCIPAAGEAGWHFGQDRWRGGAFFRFEITSYRPIGDA